MKKSGNQGSKKVILVVALVLVFAVGIVGGMAAGKYIAAKNEKKQAKVSSGTTDSVKEETGDQKTAAKENAVKQAEKKDENKEQSSQKDENEQNTSQTKENVAADTYDASVPPDDTNIHRYDFVVDDCTWQEAYQNCIDQGGYLVRINTNKEYEYIRKEISARAMTDMFFRIAGRRDAHSSDYYWVNQNNKLFGEKLNAADSWAIDEWKQGEPSFKDGNLEELYMNLFFFDGEKRFVWNDVPNDMLAAEPLYAGKLGYICEYE